MSTLDFESKIIIDKPIAFLFDFLSHQENHTHIFNANIDCRQITEGPMRVGTEVVNTASFLGSKMKEHFEIIEYKENQTIRKKTLPGSTHPSEDCFTLTALGPSQTEVSLYLIAWPTGIFRYFLFFVQPLFARQVRKDLQAFKAYVEGL
ncbi:MAG: hypothetical protein ACRBFS_11405 [Aureispira sp.]